MTTRTTAAAATLALLCMAGCAAKAPGTAIVSPPPVVSQAITAQLALPLYPGAQPTANGVHVKGPHANEIFAAYYRVNDPLPQVERYYVARLPKGSLKMYVNEPDGGTADFAIAAPGSHKQVVLASDRGGTLIALSTTKPARGQK